MAQADAEQERVERVRRFKFEKFDPNVEEFAYYIQRFELELSRFGLTGDENTHARRTLLLGSLGPEPFRMLVDHFRPREVLQQTYTDVKQALERYYTKQICTMAERVRFAQTIRKDDESITLWLNTLRGIAGNCQFGDELNTRLRDQLFIGVNNPSWQQELFRQHPNADATLAQVEATALILEKATLQQQCLQSMGTTPTESNTRRLGKHPSKSPLRKGTDCIYCGNRAHKEGEQCPAKGKTCSACGKQNHFAKVCLSTGTASNSKAAHTKQRGPRPVRFLQPQEDDSDCTDEEGVQRSTDVNAINAVHTQGRKAILQATLNGIQIKMLYDPGAAQTVISKKTWERIGSPRLSPTAALMAYTQVPVETLGKAQITVSAFGKTKPLSVSVVKHDDMSLFGLDWCIAFGLTLPKGVTICTVQPPTARPVPEVTPKDKHELQQLQKKFKEVFEEQLGTIKGHKAVVHLRPDAKPKVFPARPVPFPIQTAVESELSRLVHHKVLEPVDASTTPIEWASPIVCVVKPTGAIRICADFKVTINQHVVMDPHPLPTFERIAAKLNGCRYFSKIDLKDAYLQMEVDEASKKYLVIATHKGYFRYKRLPFGVSFAPALFQKTMDSILAGLEGTDSFIDDIIIGGRTIQEHNERLGAVLKRMHTAKLRAHLKKCEFLKTSVTYLAHRIDAEGIHPTTERIEAIHSLPSPTNASELRSFLGSINHYAKFIPRLQPLCSDLHRLTKKNAVWKWTKEDEQRVQQLKKILTSSDTLVHYDPQKPLIIATDASDKGLGAVLMHLYPDGTERPIAYASRTLRDAEKRYACIDKEALAIIFGVTKFHQYLYGRHFTLKTDHRPLEHIFGARREIPKMLNNRLVRWALTLSAYNYDIQYVQGTKNAPADALSRLPSDNQALSAEEKLGSGTQLLNLKLQDLPLTRSGIQRQTILDPLLSKVVAYIERGWPDDKKKVQPELHTFFDKQQALSYEDKILLWQGRIIIPEKLQTEVLKTIHEGHPGAAAMKAMARFHVWWPHVDERIEQFVRSCSACQENRPRPAEVPLFSWAVPSEPWSRLHIDYAGPFEGKSWLIIVDAYTKWLEIKPTVDTSASATIKLLRTVFAQFGLPRTIVSDNGPNFASTEFKEFCLSNGIKHIRSTPYHPKTNGLAERAVRTFKERFTASRDTTSDQNLRLQRFLISYRNSPHSTTGRAPAEMLFGRRLRTRLDLLKPNVQDRMEHSLLRQKEHHDKKSQHRSFMEGEKVWVTRTHAKGYDSGIIQKRTAEYSYLVSIAGKVHRKHADHLRPAYQDEQNSGLDLEVTDPVQEHHLLVPPPRFQIQLAAQPQNPSCDQRAVSSMPADTHPSAKEGVPEPGHTEEEQQGTPPPLDRSRTQENPMTVRAPSTRIRKPVVKPYDDYLSGKKLK